MGHLMGGHVVQHGHTCGMSLPRTSLRGGGAPCRRKLLRAYNVASTERTEVPRATPQLRDEKARVMQEARSPPVVPVLGAGADILMHIPPRSAVSLEDLIRNDGGAPRFSCILRAPGVARVSPQDLPYMLYLPGIDGTGLAASRQFPFLLTAFDLHSFSIPPHDRTSFKDLVQIVIDFLEVQVKGASPDRPCYLLGESFGGVLALAVAAARPDLVDRVVLCNPATSFQRSPWPTLGPILPQLPEEVYPVLPLLLSPVLGNPVRMAAYGVDVQRNPVEQATDIANNLLKMLPSLEALSSILPPPTLEWKLQLLKDGNKEVDEVLRTVQQRVLVVVGDADWLIPSAEEGRRLERALPRATVKVLEGRSHALLQEAGVNLLDLMEAEGFYVRRRVLSAPMTERGKSSFGAAAPIELPTAKELNIQAERATKFLRTLCSPIFFSRDHSGRIQRGLGGIPPDRPILFVGNHQTLSIDLGFLVEELVRERGILPRGLAHPVIFEGMGGRGGTGQDSSGFSSFMTTFGAVPVSASNFFQLMQQGEAVLLFPGGVREAYKGRGEEYRLFWPKKGEFVRMAARFNATIVPFAAVGMEDSVNMLLGPQEIIRLPIVGPMIEQRLRGALPQARTGVSVDKELEDLFLQPLVLPGIPQRSYFIFQTPIRTNRSDLKDREMCDELYRTVKGEVEAGIQYLLKERERDPYRELLPRLVYEASWGGKTAPTFTI